MAKIHNDKYYTPDLVVKKVIEVLEKDVMPINKFSRIIEPSAGAGAFLKRLPEKTIGYDIEPQAENIIKGDYLKQEIPYLKNSLVIGNPPFGESGTLHTEFIKKSMEHSDYVAFVLPGDTYKKDKFEDIELYKSYMLPELKYSGVKLKCCFNVYRKRKSKLQDKRIKNVEILIFSKSKNTTKKQEKDWLDIKSDIRFIAYGSIRVLKETDKKVRATEIKIILQEKVNINPVIEKFLKDKTKISVSTPNTSKREIIELIYDNFPQLRE
jgi:predicted RNA methylase